MGVVFNRPSEIALKDIGSEHDMPVHAEAGNAYIGGPVQRERGFLVHRSAEVADSVRLHDGVYLSVSTEALRTLLAGDPAVYRLCLGYGAWASPAARRTRRHAAARPTRLLASSCRARSTHWRRRWPR